MSDRVRCKACGSTRVRGVVAAYCDGRVTVNERGQMVVEDGDFVIHDEAAISPGSIICDNCAYPDARIERDRSAALALSEKQAR
jgi:hypothetical protein